MVFSRDELEEDVLKDGEINPVGDIFFSACTALKDEGPPRIEVSVELNDEAKTGWVVLVAGAGDSSFRFLLSSEQVTALRANLKGANLDLKSAEKIWKESKE